MGTNLQIGEIDIFYFVFYPGNLTPVKKDLILDDTSYYDKINFYFELKKSLKNKTGNYLKRKLKEKISEYNFIDE